MYVHTLLKIHQDFKDFLTTFIVDKLEHMSRWLQTTLSKSQAYNLSHSRMGFQAAIICITKGLK
jgi:hypothetical protein